VYANGSYVVLVGGVRIVLYSTDTGASWNQQSPSTVASGARNLYDVAGGGSTNLVIVGSGGYVGVCSPAAGSGVCGQSSRPFSPVASPVTDNLRAVAWRDTGAVSGAYVAVGAGGVAIGSSTPAVAASWTSASAASATTTLLDVSFSSVGGATAVGSGGAVSSCPGSCSGAGTWSPEAIGTTVLLSGIATAFGDRWVVGNTGPTGPTMRHASSAWAAQTGPALTFPRTAGELTSPGGGSLTIDTATTAVNAAWPAACPAPNLRMSVPVPPSAPGVVAPLFRVSATYSFATGVANALAVATSKDGGGQWTTPVAYPVGGTLAQTRTVEVSNAVSADADSPRTVDLCVMGRRGGGAVTLDMVHVDVEE
jgi:hypothetical protein